MRYQKATATFGPGCGAAVKMAKIKPGTALPDELVAGFAPGGGIIFVGAGASQEAEPPFPDWAGLLHLMFQEIERLHLGSPGVIRAARRFRKNADAVLFASHFRRLLEGRTTRGEEDYYTFLKSTFDRPFNLPEQGLHQALVELRPAQVWTSNFDLVLEKALGIGPGDAIFKNSDVANMGRKPKPPLLKMHGSVYAPETIVLTREDYDAYAQKNPAFSLLLQAALGTGTVLFIGFSLTDPNFKAIHQAAVQAFETVGRMSYAVMRGIDPLLQNYWRERGLNIITVGDHEEVGPLLRRLAQEARRRNLTPRRADLYALVAVDPEFAALACQQVQMGSATLEPAYVLQQVQALEEALSARQAPQVGAPVERQPPTSRLAPERGAEKVSTTEAKSTASLEELQSIRGRSKEELQQMITSTAERVAALRKAGDRQEVYQLLMWKALLCRATYDFDGAREALQEALKFA